MDSLRISLAQINGTVGDLAGNSARIAERLEEARRSGAQLVVFPGFALEGWPLGELVDRAEFREAIGRARAEFLQSTKGVAAILGTVEQPGEGTPRSAALIAVDGDAVACSGKARLTPGAPILDERRYFRMGSPAAPFEVGGWRVGVLLGDDIEPGTGVVERLVEDGVDLIVNLDAAPFVRGGPRRREERLGEIAGRFGVHIAYVNRVGGQDEFIFDGGSMVVSPSGEVIARAALFEEELLEVEIPVPGASPDVASGPAPHDDLAETWQALVVGIRDYVGKNGFRRVTLGLSGGLDSALAATLAVDALGPDAVTAVWLPSPYSTDLSRSDAFELAENLGIEILTIPIESTMQAFESVLAPHFAGREPDLTEENLQARIRGTILMALSNKFGWLLLSTSNKSETAVGYSTLYGDMAGGLAPLRDLYKSLVFELAHWRNREGVVIPESTILRPPTAELRPDQLDTDSLPDYAVLDPILERYLEERWSAEELIEEGADPDMVERVIRLVIGGEYKRRQGPPGLKVTGYAFGVDDLMPMTVRRRDSVVGGRGSGVGVR